MNKITGGSALLDVQFILGKAGVGDRMKVADLGCGASGHFVFPAARLVGKDGKVYAIDILKPVLENIKRRIKQENLENIEPIWSDLEVANATKIEPESLDVALLINTLYLSHKRGEMLREAIRLLKKGQKLVIVEWKNISSPLGPPSEERVREDLIKKAGQKLGLTLEEEFEAGPYHYGLIFIK